ncbi:CinA family protein [Pseudochelatococcus lubricantis]|uniref:CinA family protein n=1 Tax=Pseudochelatococcus lubricantis TaxID=1538102 RepID=UPI0035ED031D
MTDDHHLTEDELTALPFSPALYTRAQALLASARDRGLHIATAESCTGGLVSGLLTAVPGSSDVVEGGFVTYSNTVKHVSLGVPEAALANFGAVSEPVARAMAEGVLGKLPTADVAVAVTGIAGPAGGSPEKPVGLVHFAAARRGHPTLHTVHRFADEGRAAIRLRSVAAALGLLEQAVNTPLTA